MTTDDMNQKRIRQKVPLEMYVQVFVQEILLCTKFCNRRYFGSHTRRKENFEDQNVLGKDFGEYWAYVLIKKSKEKGEFCRTKCFGKGFWRVLGLSI